MTGRQFLAKSIHVEPKNATQSGQIPENSLFKANF